MKINKKNYKINTYSGKEYDKLIRKDQDKEKFITISELDEIKKPSMEKKKKRKPSKIESMLQDMKEEILQSLRGEIFAVRKEMKQGFSQVNSRIDRLETRMDKFENRLDYIVKANKLKDSFNK